MDAKPKHYLEYGFLRAFIFLLNVVPFRLAMLFALILAQLSRPFSAKRRKEACRRMRGIFGPDVPEATLGKWAWTSWRNLFFNAVEIARARRLNKQNIDHIIGPGALDAYKHEYTRVGGHLLAVIHMGNWDLAGFAGRLHGLPLFTIARDQSNPFFNRYMKTVRDRFNFEALDRHGSLNSIVKKIKAGGVFTLLPDVRAKTRDTSVAVPFLGGTAYLMGGMGLFARLTGKPVKICIVTRSSWTRLNLEFMPMIYPDPAIERDADIVRMTTEVMAVFDRAIRAHPDQYFWYNKRWVLDDRF